MLPNNESIPVELTDETIESLIYEIRGQKVMLDFDLARIYGYETRDFNNQVKGVVSKRTGCRLWQKLFYDHIIRDKEDYEIHMQYIDNNPAEREYDRIYFNKLRLEEATGR